MKIAVSRWCFRFLVCLVMTGCSGMPMLSNPVAEERELFAQGLDQYLASGELTTLKRLQEQYPQGQWQPRAEGLIERAEQQQQQLAQLQKREQRLGRCQAEKDALVADNRRLTGTLDRLKQVLIDMELRKE